MIVENINLFSSQSKSFGDFVRTYSDEGVYIPNEFQRDYGWEDVHIEQLLDDIIEGYEEGKYVMLNRIAVSNMGGRDFIIDGQQRVTTLFLIYDRLHRKLFPEVRCSFLIRDSFKPTITDELILRNSIEGHIYNKVLEDIVLRGVVGEAKNPINNAVRTIDEYILENIESGEYLSKLMRYIDRRVFFGVDILPEEYSINFYDDINSKGLKLDSVDKVKTYLGTLVNDNSTFRRVWMNFLESTDNLIEYGFRVRTSSTIQEFIIDCSLRTFKDNLNNGEVCGIEFSRKSSRDIDTFIRKYIDNGNTAQRLMEHSTYVADRILYYLRDCKENTYFNMLGKGTTAHMTSLILAELSGVPIRIVTQCIERVWMSFSARGITGGKSKSENSVRPINRILLKGGGEKDIVEWYTKDIEGKLFKELEIRDYWSNLSYRINSERKVMRIVLMYIEASLRSEYNGTDLYHELDALTKRYGKSMITLEHISPRKDGYELTDNIGNITLLSKTDNSRLSDKKDNKYNVYLSSDFFINKVMLDSVDNLNKTFKGRVVERYFRAYTSGELESFEHLINNRGELLSNYITEEVFRIK